MFFRIDRSTEPGAISPDVPSLHPCNINILSTDIRFPDFGTKDKKNVKVPRRSLVI